MGVGESMEHSGQSRGSPADGELPLPKHHFISFVKLCVDFGFFEFAGEENQEISGLAMGSPLSAVLACLFVETLERNHFRDIIGRRSTWLRYVDDVLVIVPSRSCLHTLTRLNSVHEKIQFRVEEEVISKYFGKTVKIASASGEKLHVIRAKKQPKKQPQQSSISHTPQQLR
ncbi:uncharacterized protein [Penaeus vannamei]|uniref:uncharacterized protein n=1 Tax=Penaeus vannamei TaxID=6689 RepID=UPI00387F5C9C